MKKSSIYILAGTLFFSIIIGFVFSSVFFKPIVKNIPTLNTNIAVAIKPDYPDNAVFDLALTDADKIKPLTSKPAIGALVNHHLLAANFISETLALAKGQTIDRIIILSPNHFFAGHGPFITTNFSFSTPYGDVQTDVDFVNSLVADGKIVNNAEPFLKEHGIYNILPFIKKYFPGVPIVPIITRDGTASDAVDNLRAVLKQKITARTLIIASLDFAHNQTNAGAAALDKTSLTELQAVDPMAIQANQNNIIAVDSPMTLRLFLGLMSDRNATEFTMTNHSNSALETGHLDATDVTSHITGIYSTRQAPEQ